MILKSTSLIILTLMFFISADLLSSENYQGSENTVDRDKTEEFEALIKRGDGYFSYSYEAIVCYKKALEIDSTNQEVIFRIAYYYDLQDSVDLAEHYYKKLDVKYLTIQDRWSKIIYPEIDINKIKMNLLYNDSLEILFKRYGKKSSITLDYEISASAFPTYNENHIWVFFYKLLNKRTFITIYGNGEFEARKYNKNKSDVYFEGKLPDSTLSIILKTLQKGRILSMKSLFQEGKKSINRFEGDYLKYLILIPSNMENPWFERIKIETPLISNSVSIMYLVDRIECSYMFGECCKDINLEYMNSIENRTKAKIKLLEELWKYIYCLDLSKYSTD